MDDIVTDREVRECAFEPLRHHKEYHGKVKTPFSILVYAACLYYYEAIRMETITLMFASVFLIACKLFSTVEISLGVFIAFWILAFITTVYIMTYCAVLFQVGVLIIVCGAGCAGRWVYVMIGG